METVIQHYIFEILFSFAIILDLLFGDPRWLFHPVRMIGCLCEFSEKIFRTAISNEKAAGVVTTTVVILTSSFFVSVILYFFGKISSLLQMIVSVVLIYLLVAIKDLLKHSMDVYRQLYPAVNIKQARIALSMIVGRDTSALTKEEISRGCVETVAENMVDGITAPIFWAVCGSLFSTLLPCQPITAAVVTMVIYKCINTMDSMFGYKNDRYIHFGWASAKLDDIVNFIPARLSGAVIIVGTLLSDHDWRESRRILLRDRCNHSSPNAGYPEAALAGALNIQLGGASYYFGELVEKPTIGDRQRQVTPQDILSTNKIVLFSSLLFFVTLLTLRGAVA